jgi:hypothetical protein
MPYQRSAFTGGALVAAAPSGATPCQVCSFDEEYRAFSMIIRRISLSSRGAEAAIPGQIDRSEPELRLASVAPYVRVHRLRTVEAVEEQPIRTRNAGNPWHDRSAPMI